MSAPALDAGPPTTTPPAGVECGVYPRHASRLAADCQPIAARGANELWWPAQIRDVSLGGLGLVLRRRFEAGTGLVVELPEGSGGTFTVIARVVRVRAESGGVWLHGCTFVSTLSEDALATLLTTSQAQPAGRAHGGIGRPRRMLAGVRLQATLPGGEVLTRRVPRLYTSATWPLPAGTRVTVWPSHWVGHGAGLDLRITDCSGRDGEWILRCAVVGAPDEAVLGLFRAP
jgi:hypothetical protein